MCVIHRNKKYFQTVSSLRWIWYRDRSRLHCLWRWQRLQRRSIRFGYSKWVSFDFYFIFFTFFSIKFHFTQGILMHPKRNDSSKEYDIAIIILENKPPYTGKTSALHFFTSKLIEEKTFFIIKTISFRHIEISFGQFVYRILPRKIYTIQMKYCMSRAGGGLLDVRSWIFFIYFDD